VGYAKYPGQGIFFLWGGDEMHMVVHQAIGKYREVVLLAVFVNPGKIFQSIFIILENIVAITSSLGNMAGQFRNVNSCSMLHAPTL